MVHNGANSTSVSGDTYATFLAQAIGGCAYTQPTLGVGNAQLHGIATSVAAAPCDARVLLSGDAYAAAPTVLGAALMRGSDSSSALLARMLAAGIPAPTQRQLRTSAVAYRSSDIAAAGSADPSTLIGLAGEAFSYSTATKTECVARQFRDFCRGAHLEATVSLHSLGAYLADRVTRRKLAPGGLPEQRYYLKRWTQLVEQATWSLTAPEERALDALVRGLQKGFPYQNARGQKKALQLHHIEAMFSVMEVKGMGPQAEMHLAQMLVAHAGMLRTAEHVARADSKPSLNVADVQFLAASGADAASLHECVGARLTLRSTKTGIGQPAPQHIIIPNRPGKLNPLLGVWEAAHRPGSLSMDPLFVNTDGSVVTRNQFIERTRYWLVAAGVPNAADFAGHSFRAGGTCDAFDSGIPWDMVVQQGRWTSDAWKKYRRGTAYVMQRWGSVCSETERLLSGPRGALGIRGTGVDPREAGGQEAVPALPCLAPAIDTGMRLAGKKRSAPCGTDVPIATPRWTFRLGDGVSHGAFAGIVVELTELDGLPAYSVQYDGGGSELRCESELTAFVPGTRVRRPVDRYES